MLTRCASSEVIERPGVWRRTVLVACPGLLRIHHELVIHISIYMKAKTTKEREAEPVGIVISRGARTDPAPLIRAFEWGPAPELSSASQDHRAA